MHTRPLRAPHTPQFNLGATCTRILGANAGGAIWGANLEVLIWGELSGGNIWGATSGGSESPVRLINLGGRSGGPAPQIVPQSGSPLHWGVIWGGVPPDWPPRSTDFLRSPQIDIPR